MLVVDANIAVKFVTAEAGQAEAFERVRTESELVAPDWIAIEVAHTLWKKSGAGYFDEAVARQNLSRLAEFFDRFSVASDLMPMAVSLAFELDHWVYDCIYLACALDIGAPLLTADRKFWNAAKRGRYGDVVELLTWESQAQ